MLTLLKWYKTIHGNYILRTTFWEMKLELQFARTRAWLRTLLFPSFVLGQTLERLLLILWTLGEVYSLLSFTGLHRVSLKLCHATVSTSKLSRLQLNLSPDFLRTRATTFLLCNRAASSCPRTLPPSLTRIIYIQ